MNKGTATMAEPVDMRRAAADGIAQSAAFRRSPRLRDMLLHIANATLNGNFEDLTETRIAAVVFGRPEYNSAEDNLVRVSARQLRAKIAEYYEGEGSHDDIVLDVPKGGYLAVFRTRDQFSFPPKPAPDLVRSISHTTWGKVHALTLVLGGLAVGLFVVAGWLWKENRQLASLGPAVSTPVLFDMLTPSAGQRTHIVLTDSALVLLEEMLHRYVPLEDYASQRYLQLAPNNTTPVAESGLLSTLRSRQISSLADFRILSAILQRYPRSVAGLSIQHARNLHIRDFDTADNFVLIGSSRSNPWASLFDSRLAFHLQSPYGSSCFENGPVSPVQRLYCVQDSANEQGTDYAHIAVLHTGNGRGRVLLIGGADMESTEAGGNFVLDPESLQPVLRALRVRRFADLPDFELLLKAHSVGGAGRSPELVYAQRL